MHKAQSLIVIVNNTVTALRLGAAIISILRPRAGCKCYFRSVTWAYDQTSHILPLPSWQLGRLVSKYIAW